MKKIIIFKLLIIYCFAVSSQTINIPTFGTDTTLEVMTWNIENFPKNGQTTLNYVKQVIEDIDVDVIAFQEISDTTLFKQMLIDLPDYQYYFKSSWYGGLAYIYKSSVIQINNIYEIYTTSPYWSPFPRAPKVMELAFNGEDFILINNHLKCCGDGYLDLNNPDDEENRRYIAANLLRDYINSNFTNNKVIVMGDLNDEISESPVNNVFQQIINDAQNFQFADMEIANGNSANWSYPTWPSHIDHILITNELFAELQNINSEIKVIKVDEYLTGGWNGYDNNISDHRPVAIKIVPDLSANINDLITSENVFSNFPNPFTISTTFNFKEVNENTNLEIYNYYGQKVNSIKLVEGQTTANLYATDYQNGIYFAKIISKGKIIAYTKIIIIR